MTPTTPSKPPVKMFGLPLWHHPHSIKLSVVGSDHTDPAESTTLILKSNAIDIRIHSDSRQNGWVVEYEIRHSLDSWNKGRVWMSKEDLRTAFGLSDNYREERGQMILANHGGDAAHQGIYIRDGKCLNIPGPGTGHDGDANVSIYVDDDIKAAVERLLR